MHSLHAYFLRPGDPTVPILYEVDRIRDGRSFTTRRVVAIQHGKAIFNLQASFHVPEEGFEHAGPDAADVPDARDAPRLQGALGAVGRRCWATTGTTADRPIDTRTSTGSPGRPHAAAAARTSRCGCGPTATLPDDPVLHACVLTYAVGHDPARHHAAAPAADAARTNVFMASLDHAMWFHRPFRADEWLLYAQDTPSASGGRGLARGSIFTHDGHLAVTVVQEGLIRVTR